MPIICSECGARLADDSDVCDLCGAAVNPLQAESAVLTLPVEPSSVEVEEVVAVEEWLPVAEATSLQSIFCNQCGWENPSDARFCSRCGAGLQDLGAARKPVSPARDVPSPKTAPALPLDRSVEEASANQNLRVTREKSDPKIGRQVIILVGSGILLVLALYMITLVSKSSTSTPPPQAAAQPQQGAPPPAQTPLPPEIASQAETLQAEIASLTGAEKQARQQQLSGLYITVQRWDLAAETLEPVAEAIDDEATWIRLGNLYYDWMDLTMTGDRSYYAKKAIAAYQRALALNPDNLDVRTDMAIAYMYDPDNSRRSIQETNIVLEKDPNHIQANFNRGIMLMQINRFTEALEQFERVKQLVGNTQDPVYQRANSVITNIRQQQPGL